MNPENPTIRARHAVRVAMLALLACMSIGAIAGVEDPEDTAAVRAVKLDMDLIHRLAAAGQALKNLPDNPQRRHSADDHEDGPAVRRADPADSVVAKINAHPGARAILAFHGLTPRDFYLGTLATVNCTFVAALAKPGEAPNAEALEKASTSAANARLCQAHLPEIARLIKAMN